MFHCNLASLLAQTGEPDEALRHHDEALRLAPHDYETCFNRGNLLARQGRIAAVAEGKTCASYLSEFSS